MNRMPSALVRIEMAAAPEHEPELDVLRPVLGISSAIGTCESRRYAWFESFRLAPACSSRYVILSEVSR